MTNKWNDKELSALLAASQPPLKPSLTDKALAEMTEAVRTRRTSSALTEKKKILAAAAVLALVAGLMFWLLPRRGLDSALANMARAMAQVQSAHCIGVSLDYDTGKYLPIECWVKGPTKMRLLTKGKEDEIHNGQTKTVINLQSTPTIVHISSEYGPDPAMGVGATYLNLFLGDIAKERTEGSGGQISSEKVTLPDGRPGFVVKSIKGEWRDIYTIAADTDLLVSWERYLKEKLTDRIERVEYNTRIPDSLFAAEIPKGAIIVNWPASPSSKPPKLPRTATTQFGTTEDIDMFQGSGRGSSFSSIFHTKLHFESTTDTPLSIVYRPTKNAYRVQGEVRVQGLGLDRIVKNSEFTAPEPPDVTYEKWKEQEAERARESARLNPSPEVLAWRKAKGRELAASGAKGFGMTCAFSTGGYYFETLEPHRIEVWYSPSRKAFYVMGKAHVSGHGLDQIVEDDWIKAPSPPSELPE
jgi:outer membrane lipoprotein-sorting protein